ncbi:2',3'-cyclic-nucleotide 2'-phosphodiesterase [Vibrio ishigakensis]|uniref:2',3'-cyclic-nucleotide 2'-phosphodiesterase n=1 Tax=Vibrio ishigakensis TaxID=1481914 RepID=A0A0B8QLI0_9VIBR|nr:2',3'-cyclic-nucleotide 2'-phosphodiesterase [Vibrio ishigakensis]
MVWDKKHLEGRVTTADITETAKKLVPQMKKEGADVLLLSHTLAYPPTHIS